MDRSLPRTDDSLVAVTESVPPTRSREQLEPSRGATALGVVFALGIHLGVIALSPREAALATVAAPPCEVEIFEPLPPAPQPEKPEPAPEPVQAVMVPRPKPVMQEAPKKEVAPPPKAAEDTPPAPAPVEPVVEKPSEPAPALVAEADGKPSDHTIVQNPAGALGGRGTGAPGVPGGTGTGPVGAKQGVVGGTGVGAAQVVTLSLKNWNCPWPEDAEYEDFDQQVVAIRVVVAEDGHVEKADIVSDPGHGFGKAARDCARRVRFNPAKDSQGRAIKAMSPPINVRFVR